jgi:hypothetical protein
VSRCGKKGFGFLLYFPNPDKPEKRSRGTSFFKDGALKSGTGLRSNCPNK